MVDGEKVTYWLKVIAGYVIAGYALAYFFTPTDGDMYSAWGQWVGTLFWLTVIFFSVRWLARQGRPQPKKK